MNISSVSNLNYYKQSSTLRGTVSSTNTDEETTTQGNTTRPAKPSGPPPQGPPPDKKVDLDTNGDNSWDSEELSAYAETASEYGVELDVDALMSEYDSDEDGILGESEIKSLMDNNGLKLPEPPPKNSSPEEQSMMMAQMQSSTNLNASTISITDYLTEDEEDEDTVNSLSLESITSKLNEYLFSNEEDEEEEESATLSTEEATSINLKNRLYESYSRQMNYDDMSEYPAFYA